MQGCKHRLEETGVPAPTQNYGKDPVPVSHSYDLSFSGPHQITLKFPLGEHKAQGSVTYI